MSGLEKEEDELLLPPPSTRAGRRAAVRITPAKIPTVPSPVWPEYLYSYGDGDGGGGRTIFAPAAATRLDFGLVIPGKRKRRRRPVWHLWLRSINRWMELHFATCGEVRRLMSR